MCARFESTYFGQTFVFIMIYFFILHILLIPKEISAFIPFSSVKQGAAVNGAWGEGKVNGDRIF